MNFQEMFGELFGGGKANLLLTDESDPLESGIDIIAKPPGKQLQSISLLSRRRTHDDRRRAALLHLHGEAVPFCVLDEMDAPLDESNINRFIKILDRFVGQSQFIVISHHKRTIARADALYGVTMEEHGVSKLVGVKFARRDDSHENETLSGPATRTRSRASPKPSENPATFTARLSPPGKSDAECTEPRSRRDWRSAVRRRRLIGPFLTRPNSSIGRVLSKNPRLLVKILLLY